MLGTLRGVLRAKAELLKGRAVPDIRFRARLAVVVSVALIWLVCAAPRPGSGLWVGYGPRWTVGMGDGLAES